MTAGELINLLLRFDPVARIVLKVDGSVTRTGDYVDIDGIETIRIEPVSYGGYELNDNGEKSGLLVQGFA